MHWGVNCEFSLFPGDSNPLNCLRKKLESQFYRAPGGVSAWISKRILYIRIWLNSEELIWINSQAYKLNPKAHQSCSSSERTTRPSNDLR